MNDGESRQETILIHTPYIQLDQMLKFCGEAMSGSDAKRQIYDGEIMVNGEVCLERGRKLREGDRILVAGLRTYLIDYEINEDKDKWT